MKSRVLKRAVAFFVLAATASSVLVSCDSDNEVVRLGASRIVPAIAVDATVITPAGIDRSLLEVVPQPSEFSFKLESIEGNYSHSWASITDYPLDEILRPGTYTVSATYGSEYTEGLEKPYFYGERNVMLASGEETPVELTVKLASAAYTVEFEQNLVNGFVKVGALLHSDSHSYVEAVPGAKGVYYMYPGNASLSLTVTASDGRNATMEICNIPAAAARHLYNVVLSSDGATEPTVTATVNDVDCGEVKITQALLDARAPELLTVGFSDNQAISVTEGEIPAYPIAFDINGEAPASLILTTQSPSLTDRNWPSHIDLAKASASELANLEEKGLKIERGADNAIKRVDLTGLMANLRCVASGMESRFSLLAIGANGKMSQVKTLEVDVKPVEIGVLSVSDIVIGIDMAEMTIISHSGDMQRNLSVEAADADGVWTGCAIEAIEPRAEGEYAVRFSVPESNLAEQPVRIKYFGAVLNEVVLRRVAPEYSVAVDPFALSAVVKVTANDKSLESLITSMMRVYVDNNPLSSASRDPENGILRVGPLEPSRSYTLKTTLLDNPAESDFTPSVLFRTESILQVKNSDFEDHEDGIVYNRMPSGGRYSQTIADVFNCQNYSSFKVQRPRDWASTNDKTFCRAASNLNTWYLAPSAMSEVDNVEGYVAVKLQSVAWDVTGEKIADYRQQSGEFLPYNPNVPNIKYRAAGKLFLGKYKFDAATLSETYTEGISFTSRPVALNGNYHFTPCLDDLYDCGYVQVEVLGVENGVEIAIARGEAKLQPALTYTAFSVPLSYENFGVKATKLKVMLSSSQYVGSIDYESRHIKTSADPVTSTSTGGTLWLQDITLSYF